MSLLHPDQAVQRNLGSQDIWRDAGLFWYSNGLALWIAASSVNPLPVNPVGTGEATTGADVPIVTVAGVEGQLLAADANRINFWVMNYGGAVAYLRHVTPAQAAPATVNDQPILAGQRINADTGAHFEWRYIDGGVATQLRVKTFVR